MLLNLRDRKWIPDISKVFKPDFYPQMTKEQEFAETEYAPKLQWLSKDNEDIYVPEHSDMLRVAFMYSFDRGKLADLESLLSGRDFETREFKEEIMRERNT